MAGTIFEKQCGTFHFAVQGDSIIIASRFKTRGMGHVMVAYAENDMHELIPFPYDPTHPGTGLRSKPCGDPEPSSMLCVSMSVRPKQDTMTVDEAVKLLKEKGFKEDVSLIKG